MRALGVKGSEAELRTASDEFSGHCLALTLLGSYLTDAYDGDIRCREEVSNRLAQDVRQGAHAQKVMASYQSWFGEGPELSMLRLLGLFDRPADEKALGVLLKLPAIPGLTESLTDLRPTAWRTILAKLRRARLLAGEDLHNPGHLDTHPDWRATGSRLLVPYWLALKAEALHLADHVSEALEAIKEAEALVETSGERWWCAELYRLHGVFLAAIGTDEAQIEAAFRAAIKTAKEQQSTSLAKRAEASYAEYRDRKGELRSGGHSLPAAEVNLDVPHGT